MNILDKTKLDPFSYVVLPTDFEVTDKSQIIFAPNGTGKTTLFNILVKQNTNNCEVYTYDDSCEPTYKLVCSSKRKKLLINPLSKNYSKEEEHKKEEATKLNPKTVISILYPNQTVAKLKKADIDSNILKVIQENVCTLYAPLDNEDRKKLSFILPYFQDIKNVISKRTNLMLLTEEQKKSDSEALKLADRSIIYDYYNVEKHKDDIEHNGCPLCGNRADNVYNEILRIKKEVLSAKFAFFEGFDFLRHLPKGVAPLDAINKTISGINGLSES